MKKPDRGGGVHLSYPFASSHGQLGDKPNGTYLPELTHALHVLERAGITWDLASPASGP